MHQLIEESTMIGREAGVDDQGTDFYSAVIEKARPKRAFKKLLLGFLPNHALEHLRYELRMLLVRVRSANRADAFHQQKDLLLNVGAGKSGKQGWVNVDAVPVATINCLYDARTRLPFPTGSVRGIFCEHFFEHIHYTEEAPRFLSECYRVLQDGGVLRIIVPDAEKYLMAYAQGGWGAFQQIRPLDAELRDRFFGWQYNTRMELVNHVFRQGQEHKFAYDFETLEFLLKRNGFHDVRRQEFGRSVMAGLCIDAEIRKAESLYVEAIKQADCV